MFTNSHHGPGPDGRPLLLPILVATCLALTACGGSSGEEESSSARNGGGAGAGTSKKAAPPEADPVGDAIREIRSSHPITTAAGAWDAAAALATKAEAAYSEGRRRYRVAEKALRDEVLNLDPDFAPAREKAGQKKYGDQLLPFVEAAWLPEVDRARAKKEHERILRLAKKDHGWVPAASLDPVVALATRLGEAKKKHESLLESPWYKNAKVIQDATVSELESKMAAPGGETVRWDGTEVVLRQPFIFFFQKDAGWDPQVLKERRAEELMGVQESILQDYGERLGLEPLPGPIPVVFLRSRKAYAKYKGEKLDDVTSEAHFEPWNGRLVVHDACKFTTLRHEATHQAMWTWTKKKRPTAAESYWFQEGVADWYGAAKRVRDDETGKWKYVMGRVEQGHLASLRRTKDGLNSDKIFSLVELLKTRYAHKPKIQKDGRESLIYQQGWLLIYFLNFFNVDDKGMVDPSKPGIYRERWEKFFQAQLEGKVGFRSFLDATGFTEKDLARLEEEMWQYFEFLRYKAYSVEHLDEYGRLVRWDQYVNSKGKKTGEEEDDLLVR